jgi:hypothetical protein
MAMWSTVQLEVYVGRFPFDLVSQREIPLPADAHVQIWIKALLLRLHSEVNIAVKAI